MGRAQVFVIQQQDVDLNRLFGVLPCLTIPFATEIRAKKTGERVTHGSPVFLFG